MAADQADHHDHTAVGAAVADGGGDLADKAHRPAWWVANIIVLEVRHDSEQDPSSRRRAGAGVATSPTDVVTPDDVNGRDHIVRGTSSRRSTSRRLSKGSRTLGVQLKREEPAKLCPVTDSARHRCSPACSIAAKQLGVTVQCAARYGDATATGVGADAPSRHSADTDRAAQSLFLCTGGKSLQKSGSDGAGLRDRSSLGAHDHAHVQGPSADGARTEGFTRSSPGIAHEGELITLREHTNE